MKHIEERFAEVAKEYYDETGVRVVYASISWFVAPGLSGEVAFPDGVSVNTESSLQTIFQKKTA